MRLPFFVWSQLVAALLLLLAFPSLQAAAILQLMDRVAGTSFFLPTGLVVSGMPVEGPTGGGNPLLWQHLFWFLGHPEVYVLILPAIGIVAEVIANNTRRPLWGYRAMVASVLFIGVHVAGRLGAPHVPDRHGHAARRVLPVHDDDHLDSVGRAGHLADAVAVGRLDPLHDADALRAGVPADVRASAVSPACRSASPRATSRCTTRGMSSGTFTIWSRPGRSSRSSPASITGFRRSPAIAASRARRACTSGDRSSP